jgi:putative ABC transport system substrate-binding protein
MRRRDFIQGIGASAAWPFAARAQQPRQVGVLMSLYSQSDREGQASIAAFLDAFQKLGWTDGRNARIEYRWGAGDAERQKTAALELVHLAPDAIVVAGSPAVADLQRLTSTIPIVFTQVGDPVIAGFVRSLARPDGNITGFEGFEPAMGGKWLGVLKEAMPNLSRAAVLFGSDSGASTAYLRTAEAIAPSLGVAVTPVDVVDSGAIERAVAAFAGQPDNGLVVLPHPRTSADRGSIIILAARYRLPAIYPSRIFTAEGGLLSYGFDPVDTWRDAATYVDRILRGEKPADLPVQTPTKFELIVNLKTANALGLTVSASLTARADEVIE